MSYKKYFKNTTAYAHNMLARRFFADFHDRPSGASSWQWSGVRGQGSEVRSQWPGARDQGSGVRGQAQGQGLVPRRAQGSSLRACEGGGSRTWLLEFGAAKV